jgi:hypothetical protein
MTIEERYTHWQGIIEEQKTSGTTIAEFCRSRIITSSQFYTWRYRIRQRQNGERGFVELKTAGTDTGIRIHPRENFFVEVSKGFDPSTLRAVLAVLGNR